MIKFFSMNEFQSCLPGQKLKMVKTINEWSAACRSLLITGFIDNDDDVPMAFNEERYPDEPLTKISVTDFLANMVKAGDGKTLFHKVYPPFRGTREVLCELHQFAQAHSYSKVALGELSRTMDKEAMMLVFEEPDNAVIYARTHEVWEPHLRAISIENMPIQEKKIFQSKRGRKEQSKENPNETKSTKTAWSTIPTSITAEEVRDQQPISTMTSNNGNFGISAQEF
jgi:hypothetical protein